MSPDVTDLAHAQINGDEIKVQLYESVGRPARIKITWPSRPTGVDPAKFPDVASAMALLFARAHVVLASLKAGGEISDFSSFTDD
jgi:hypothetical protein